MGKESTDRSKRERKFTASLSSPSSCKRILSIEIPLEEVEREEALILREMRKELRVPGFRKGKVPIAFIKRNYADVIHSDAVRNLLPLVYESALAREGISPVGEPKFENLRAEKGEGISVDIALEVRPDVKIKNYTGLKVAARKREIGQKEVDETLGKIQERMATYKTVERAAQGADYLVIDYAPILPDGGVDNKEMARNYPVDLSSQTLLKEFREGLVGLSAGGEKTIAVRYPSDFPDQELAGTEKTFHVSVREVKEKIVPELDDDFAKRVGSGFSSLEKLKERVMKDLVEEEEERFKHEVEEKIIDELIEKNPFEIPEAMVENYLSSIIEEDRKRRLEVPSEEEREKEVREVFYQAAIRTVRKYFIIEAIKRQENLELTGEEIEARIKVIASSNQRSEEEIKEYFQHPERRERLESRLLDEKTLNFLVDRTDINTA